jgi:hypothetical protein
MAAKVPAMKPLIPTLALLFAVPAFAASNDVNQLFKDACSDVSHQSGIGPVTFDYCMNNGQFKIEGSYSSGFWWGTVVFPATQGEHATYSCDFDIRTDYKFRTYKCERHESHGE